MASDAVPSPPSKSPPTSRKPSLSRHHSRSSSHLSTLASLSLSPTGPPSPRLASPRLTNISPRSSQYGTPASMGMTPWSDHHSTSHDDARNSRSAKAADDSDAPTRSSSPGSSTATTESSSSSISIPASSSPPPPPPRTKSSTISDRRKTLPAIGSPSPLSHLISTASSSTSSSPVPSPDQAPTTTSSLSTTAHTVLSALPPTDPVTPAQTSFPGSSIGLAQLIQQKRRQASAPYFHTARTHAQQPRFVSSPSGAGTSTEFGANDGRGSSFTVMSGGGTGANGGTNWYGAWGSNSSAIASTSSDAGSPILGGIELSGQSLPSSRSRSRHGSRRSTTSGKLSLQTTGLHLSLATTDQTLLNPHRGFGPDESEEGMVMTPTTEEWRSLGGKLSELADLRAKDEERLRRKEEDRLKDRGRDHVDSSPGKLGTAQSAAEPVRSPKKIKRNPLRPSLWDVSSDEDDNDSSSSDDLGLTLNLSRATSNGKTKKSTSTSTLPKPVIGSPENGASLTERPKYSHVPKSSFSYSSTGRGAAGGFVSHSNTSSLSSLPTPVPSSEETPKLSLKTPDSEPLPAAETFKPTHRPQKSDSSVQLHPTNVARPALSRGSLTSASGGLKTSSSAPIVINQEGKESCSPPKGLGLPKIPLPPNVYKSLEEGLIAHDGGGGGGTPLSTAPTPNLDHSLDPIAGTINAEGSTPYEPPFAPPSPARDETGAVVQAVDLDWTKPPGPVDPRTYSAVTGLRNIESFVVEREEAGKGAYGSVKRAREKGPDGEPIGPDLIIKYVIKQRILADCWKKHKILGPIPIEVHVLDHLRRVPYSPRPHLRYLKSNRDRERRVLSYGARNRNGGLSSRRDSIKPEVDLWHGGEDGGAVSTGHPNICGLLDFFEDGEFYYLVMPQATASVPTSESPSRPGQDLFDFVDLNPTGLPPRPIARILSQVADALAFLHEHSIVHRDIKDENVVLDGEGNVRLIDFGSAAYVKDGRFFDTFSGTLDFAAPEVLKGARYSGREQDVWALGVLGYVLICGECPFWSPEEAMRGLAADSRALAQLRLKLPDSDLGVAGGSPSNQVSSSSSLSDDLHDEPSMADAIDLVTRCLEIDLANRPSADAACDHVFLAGEGGWRGRRGWIAVDSGEEEIVD
ncbi:uncharacterized protein JCM15063_003726 [Sporobolomyces koalae]|uniref:uncharacterized protein n=1 Tax=Sporobolomyces koalae TaxID=500713 RepID=UPI003170C4F7